MEGKGREGGDKYKDSPVDGLQRAFRDGINEMTPEDKARIDAAYKQYGEDYSALPKVYKVGYSVDPVTKMTIENTFIDPETGYTNCTLRKSVSNWEPMTLHIKWRESSPYSSNYVPYDDGVMVRHIQSGETKWEIWSSDPKAIDDSRHRKEEPKPASYIRTYTPEEATRLDFLGGLKGEKSRWPNQSRSIWPRWWMNMWGEDDEAVYQGCQYKGHKHQFGWVDAGYLGNGFNISCKPVSREFYEAMTGRSYPNPFRVRDAKLFLEIMSQQSPVNEPLSLPTKYELRAAGLTFLSERIVQDIRDGEERFQRAELDAKKDPSGRPRGNHQGTLTFEEYANVEKGHLEEAKAILLSHPYIQEIANILQGREHPQVSLDQVLNTGNTFVDMQENGTLRRSSSSPLFPRQAAIMQLISQNEATSEMDDDQIVQGFRIRFL